MKDLQIFNFQDTPVRAVVVDGDPWFVAADVARILGYRDAHNLVRRLDAEDRGTRPVSTPSGDQLMVVISEAGLYVAVLGSQVEGAKDFKRWVTRDVLPAIRKTGSYAPTVELTGPALMARAVLEAQDTIKALEADAERNAPKVIFADAVSTSHTSILVGELAKILRGNGVDIGQNRLFADLRERGFLIRRSGTDWNMPTQRSMELGLFKIKETAVTHSDGHVTVSKTPKVTGKGQQYFIDMYLDPNDGMAIEVAA